VTETNKIKVVLTSAYILYLANGLLDKQEKTNLSTIRLTNMLFKQNSKKENIEFVELSNVAWANVVQKFKNDNMRLAIFQAVETLWFNNLDPMVETYGQHSTDVVLRFVDKQAKNGASSDIIKETNIVVDCLTEEANKVIFDYLKGKK
jgi:hypothetical protein